MGGCCLKPAEFPNSWILRWTVGRSHLRATWQTLGPHSDTQWYAWMSLVAFDNAIPCTRRNWLGRKAYVKGRKKRIMQFLFLPHLVEFCGNMSRTRAYFSHSQLWQGDRWPQEGLPGSWLGYVQARCSGIHQGAVRTSRVLTGGDPCHLRLWIF